MQAWVETPAITTFPTCRFRSLSGRSVPSQALSRVFSRRVIPVVSSSATVAVPASPWKR